MAYEKSITEADLITKLNSYDQRIENFNKNLRDYIDNKFESIERYINPITNYLEYNENENLNLLNESGLSGQKEMNKNEVTNKIHSLNTLVKVNMNSRENLQKPAYSSVDPLERKIDILLEEQNKHINSDELEEKIKVNYVLTVVFYSKVRAH